MKDEGKWDLLGYIFSSKHRLKVLRIFEKDVMMPNEIAKKTCIRINHVSNILKQLMENGFIRCENPSAKKGRLYTITDKGRQILEMIKMMDK